MPKSPDSALEVKAWDDLDRLTYAEARKLDESHHKAPATDEAVSGMHFLEYFPELGNTPDQVHNAVRQAVADGNATLGLVKDAGRVEPVRFSRRRNYNTGTDLFCRGYLIEELLVLPNSKIRIFHNISNDPSRALMMALSQTFLDKLAGYSKAAGRADALEGFRTREPLSVQKNAVHNLYLDAKDLKSTLKESTLEERIELMRRVSLIDLTLHSHSRGYMGSDEGKTASLKPREWRSLLRRRPLFGGYDFTLETLEKIILPADSELSKQLREAKMIDGRGKLMNGSAAALMTNPQIKTALELLGTFEKSDEPIGFSMGDLNPGNVMVYKDGGIEFIDFEHCKMAPVTSLLFPRWVRGGVYGADGAAVKIAEGDAEKRLLEESYKHHSKIMPGHSREDFLAGFQKHKTAFLLQMARRYKKYEKIDSNPDRMRALKRYYYSWFAGELEKQGKVSGADDARLDYLNRLFEKPLSREEMTAVFNEANPAFSYRSELSPVTENLEKKIQDDRKKTVEGYRRKKTLRSIVNTAVVGLAGAAMLYFGGTAYLAQKRSEEFKQQIEMMRAELREKEATLNQEEKDKEMKEKYEDVRMYYMYRAPSDTPEVLARNRIRALVDRFYPKRDPHLRYEERSDPESQEWRQKHPEWHGSLLTAFAVYLDRETAIEGLLATHCTDWHCELGEWFNKKYDEIREARINKFRQEHPDCKDLPMSLFHNKYGDLHSYITCLYGAGSIDSWAFHPEKTYTERLEDQTHFLEHPVFGQRHRCKLYQNGHPNDDKPGKNDDKTQKNDDTSDKCDFFGWPRGKW